MTMTPLKQPDDSSRWWWVRFKRTKRSQRSVLLVEIVEHDGERYCQPWQDHNCYPPSFFLDWEGEFLPATGPPEEWCK